MPDLNNFPFDQGYYAKLPNISADGSGNGALENQDSEKLPLWITAVNADFAMGGGFAQSRMKRTFFPRNFVQPAFTIEGITPNQYEYGRLTEFIRQTQLQAVQREGNDILTFLRINGGGMKGVRNMRGAHQGFLLGGFIQSIERKAEMGVNAPTWQFAFQVVTAKNNSVLESSRTRGRILRAWTGIIDSPTILGTGSEFETGEDYHRTGEGDYILPPDFHTEIQRP